MGDTTQFHAMIKRVVAATLPAAYEAAVKAAEQIANNMRAAASVKSGKLRDSIRIELRPPFGVRILAGGPSTTKPVRKGQTATYDYALAQEFGTREERARPFFYPMWRLNKRAARSRINRAMKKAIEDAAKK
jgi:HK97 gp10 family phage protein